MRRIVGLQRVDKRRMDELGGEVGVKGNFKKKLERSWLKWDGLFMWKD